MSAESFFCSSRAAGALRVEDGVVLLLHGAVRARALALDLQALTDVRRRSRLLSSRPAPAQRPPCSARAPPARARALAPGFDVRQRALARLAVAGEALLQQLQLLGRGLRRARRSAASAVCSSFIPCSSPAATSSSYRAEASARLSSSALADSSSRCRARSPRAACNLSSSARRESMPAFLAALPPVIEPPAWMSCPSSVTMRDPAARAAGDGDGVRERLRHQRAAQQVFKDVAVLPVEAHEVRREAEAALVLVRYIVQPARRVSRPGAGRWRGPRRAA